MLELNLPALRGPVKPLADWIIDTHGLQQLWERAASSGATRGVFDRLLHALDVTVECAESDVERLPQQGPLLIVANHPHGLLDGLILGSLLARRRRGFRLLANSVLGDLAELRPYVIPVDVFGGQPHCNGVAARAAVRWMRGGGALVAFPAGEVSALSGLPPTVSDREWSPGPLHLAKLAGAKIVHAFVSGHNSIAFQMAGLAHPGLRTLLLGRELLNKRGKTVRVALGRPVPASQDADGGAMRRRTYLLCKRGSQPAHSACHRVPVAAPETADSLSRDVAALPAERLLYSSGEYEAYLAPAWELPHVLREIGRLRELTFRLAGEGTGEARDLDAFDQHYQHLFLWNSTTQEIIGAYRLTPVQNAGNLYTRTLFRFDREFLRHVSPGLELGRAFVRVEYQRNPQPLFFLWRAIGARLSRDPNVRYLIGPVSISNAYQHASREVIVQYLGSNRGLPLPVDPVNPFRPKPGMGVPRIHDLEELSHIIADLELDGKGIPVLLRHYLALGARIVSFNVDTSFSDALDALIVIDLLKAPERMLARYMRRESLAAYWNHHRGILQ